MSTSKPAQRPWLSGAAKPAMPVGTPQLIWPACLTLSSVAPACATPASPQPDTGGEHHSHPQPCNRHQKLPIRRSRRRARGGDQPPLVAADANTPAGPPATQQAAPGAAGNRYKWFESAINNYYRSVHLQQICSKGSSLGCSSD